MLRVESETHSAPTSKHTVECVCSPSRWGRKERNTLAKGMVKRLNSARPGEAKTDTVHIATSTLPVGHYIMVHRTNHTPRQYRQDRQES